MVVELLAWCVILARGIKVLWSGVAVERSLLCCSESHGSLLDIRGVGRMFWAIDISAWRCIYASRLMVERWSV